MSNVRYWETPRMWQTCQEGQIKAYRKFPKLYDERKFARSFVSPAWR